MRRSGGVATTLGLTVVSVVVGLLVVLALRSSTAATTTTERAPLPTTAPTPSERPAALFFGDSYFNGSSYAGRLQSMGYLAGTQLGYLTMVGGQGGTGFVHARPSYPDQPGAGDYLRQIQQGALKTVYPPRLVVVQGGLNDRGEDGIETAARRVLARLERAFPGVPVVLVGPVDLERTDPVAEALERAAQAHDVPFIDARDWPLEGVLGADGVHPTKEGSKVLARRLVADLRRVGVKPASAL